jgi:signal transduction histidine kinase
VFLSKYGIKNQTEAIGKTDFDFFTEEHAVEAYNDEMDILERGITISKEEKETHSNKPDTWVSTVKMPLLAEDGTIAGTFGISRDITARKRNEEEKNIIYDIIRGTALTTDLKDFFSLVHRNLSKLIYAGNMYIALFDQVRKVFTFPFFIDEFNPEAEPVLPEKSCTTFVFNTERPLLLNREIYQRLSAEGFIDPTESLSPSWLGVPLKTPSGPIGVLVLHHHEKDGAFSTQDVDFLVSVCSQIAIVIARKSDEEEIRKKNEMLQLMNAEKDKFFSIIAHDLRGPIGSFFEATKLITESGSILSVDEILELTEMMKKEAAALYNLLENLLQWSRFRRGAMEFEPVKFNLFEIVEGSIDALKEHAHRKGVILTHSIPRFLELTADINMFRTVIRNLVSNAIKFTKANGEVSITAQSTQNNPIEILIKDTGIGMDNRLLEKLFTLSEKTSRPGTDSEPSSGLGLHLCKEFIDKHKGELLVESMPGVGSVFKIILP